MADAQIEAAMIAANATIQAAKIASRATRDSALVTVGGAGVTLLSALLVAYFTYRAAYVPLREANKARTAANIMLLSDLHTQIISIIGRVDSILKTYEGNFEAPVELCVMPSIRLIEGDTNQEYLKVEKDISVAVALVKLTLDQYRRAKHPIEERNRALGKKETVRLRERPDDFDSVIGAARSYKRALLNLRQHVERFIESGAKMKL